MADSIIVQGGKDMGDCVFYEGQWWIRRDSWYENAAEMEDAFDVFIPQSGYYSKLELPQTAEDAAFVQAFVAEKERKEQLWKDKIYRENNFSLFVPAIGQRVFYRLMRGEKTHGSIVELSKTNSMVRVLHDGKKVPTWVSPYYLDLEEHPHAEGFSRETEQALSFYDLKNEARNG